MSEKDIDSSINEYEVINRSDEYIKQIQWDMTIGLQEVDNLKPSKQLKTFRRKHYWRNVHSRSKRKIENMLCLKRKEKRSKS